MRNAFCFVGGCRVAVALLTVIFLAGCASMRFGNYTAPEVWGRVLAADTRQPLVGVAVSRVSPEGSRNAISEKGVQSLRQAWTVKTGDDGSFVYPSQSYFMVFQSGGGWSLSLSLQASGYVALQTNLLPTKVTGTLPDGKPLVDLGDILLEPAVR